MARGGGTGGLIVGDVGLGVGGIGEAINLPPAPGKSGSTLELLSDPQGVDFRPYLIMVLSSVRRNWYAVIPESAKYGRRGKVVIQFAISRDGRVPKLVIVTPSGTEALDRAAVAGVSASNPFPPLPTEFQGQQIRLQFVFAYNIRE
jgi:TonB family protein